MQKNGLKIIAHNIEGFSQNKTDILASLDADILCLQETHRTADSPPGMHLAVYTPNRVYGSAIFVRDQAMVQGTEIISSEPMEFLKQEMQHLTIISIYKPPNDPFIRPPNLIMSDKTHLVLGDFNSHCTEWGYEEDDQNGEEVLSWALHRDMCLLFDAKEPPTFMSGRLRRGYNPDLGFVTSGKANLFHRKVLGHVPRSQHRPVQVKTQPALQPLIAKYLPGFNYRKAKWTAFTSDIEDKIETIPTTSKSYDDFTKLLWNVAKMHIPRGCRKRYIPGLTTETSQMYEEYVQA
ncbi:uncharacterized protein LOC122246598 [Penaeus japonicus]|uniref:uncharacterized protein LOC122246598 n=1 Tax=Penaeus japonicus TaxID=27405 RepID=UPI001C70ECAE|nr:uncharacterized protein LOC122246598 [Penaeus japonicus]